MQIEENNMDAERRQTAAITATQLAARKAKEAEDIKELQAKFDNFVAAADNYVKENKFDKALEGYTNALKIAPDAIYPKQQAEKIRLYFAQQDALQESFKAAVAAGDESFKSRNYEKAKSNYEKAAEINSEDTYVLKKLGELNKLLSYKKPSGIGKINEKDFNDE
jgi:tetratricopeptide (TPR) repeat protein